MTRSGKRPISHGLVTDTSAELYQHRNYRYIARYSEPSTKIAALSANVTASSANVVASNGECFSVS